MVAAFRSGPTAMTSLQGICFLCVLWVAVVPTEQGLVYLIVNTTAPPLHQTDSRFLSLGIDVNLVRNRWQTFDFHSTRLRTLAKGLSPSYLRLSGTDADRLIYKPDDNDIYPTERQEAMPVKQKLRQRGVPQYPFPTTNFSMTTKDWDNINQFAQDVGWRIIFGLNAQLRFGDHWAIENAIQLLTYSSAKGYLESLDFELGNEPDLYPVGKGFRLVTPKQLARDYTTLKKLLTSELMSKTAVSPKLLGPAVADFNGGNYMKFFLNYLENDVVAATTFHQYYRQWRADLCRELHRPGHSGHVQAGSRECEDRSKQQQQTRHQDLARRDLLYLLPT